MTLLMVITISTTRHSDRPLDWLDLLKRAMRLVVGDLVLLVDDSGQ